MQEISNELVGDNLVFLPEQLVFIKRSNGQVESDWKVKVVENKIVTVYKKDLTNPSGFLYKKVALKKLEELNLSKRAELVEKSTKNISDKKILEERKKIQREEDDTKYKKILSDLKSIL
jgi:hypothetical protein